jgi:hypothetical protein
MTALDALKEELARRADVLLEELLGRPTSRSMREWRWGRHGSLSYSPSLRAYYDHEEQTRGPVGRHLERRTDHRPDCPL